MNVLTPKDSVSKLIFELSKLPGIGEKTAARLTHHILKQETGYAQSLAEALLDAKKRTQHCATCFTFSEGTTCSICVDPARDRSVICVVEKPSDVFSIEQSGAFKGLYHVLHGALSPLDGVGPEELKIQELLMRIGNEPALKEILLATNPSVEGEATSAYLTRLLKPFALRVTKLAHGIQVGGLIEYTDRQTLSLAIANRLEQNAGQR